VDNGNHIEVVNPHKGGDRKIPSAEDVLGYCGSLVASIFGIFPTLLILFFGNLSSITGVPGQLAANVTLLIWFALFLIVFVGAFALLGGYAGINSMKSAAGMGVWGGLICFGCFIFWEMYTGAVTYSINLGSWADMIYMGIVLLGTIMGSFAIYVSGQHAKD
jgi:hypothetical protein